MLQPAAFKRILNQNARENQSSKQVKEHLEYVRIRNKHKYIHHQHFYKYMLSALIMQARLSSKYIRNTMQTIVGHFDLTHQQNLPTHLFLSHEHHVLILYLELYPDLDSYGVNYEKRIQNISRFINSTKFKKYQERLGAQVFWKQCLNRDISLAKRIKEKVIRDKYYSIFRRIKSKTKQSDCVILFTHPRDKKEFQIMKEHILVHELTHIVMRHNRINFAAIAGYYWNYDEGLATYCEALLSNKLDQLENELHKAKSKVGKQYYQYAIKFRELLKNKNTPRERREALLNLYDKLSRRKE